MRTLFGIAALAGLIGCGSAEAAVEGVVTSTTAVVNFKPDAQGSPTTYTFSGSQISGNLGSTAYGSGANFAATSSVANNLVSFENGNASGGEYAYSISQTDVNINFTNDSSNPVIPKLMSEIIPAGLGVYVGSACLGSLTSCQESKLFNFQDFNPEGSVYSLAGASMDFKILSQGTTLYDMTVSVDLVHDPVSNTNYFIDNIARGLATLNGFELQTPIGKVRRCMGSTGEPRISA